MRARERVGDNEKRTMDILWTRNEWHRVHAEGSVRMNLELTVMEMIDLDEDGQSSMREQMDRSRYLVSRVRSPVVIIIIVDSMRSVLCRVRVTLLSFELTLHPDNPEQENQCEK
jgi:hypothetical protein